MPRTSHSSLGNDFDSDNSVFKNVKISRLIKQKAYSKKKNIKKNVDPRTLFNNSAFSSKNSKALVTMQLLNTEKNHGHKARKMSHLYLYILNLHQHIGL